MIVKLEDREALIALANDLKDKYMVSDFVALTMAENEIEKQMKMGELENE